ncbi:MAG: recombinase RecT [Candidatus Auribacterota bacterium]
MGTELMERPKSGIIASGSMFDLLGKSCNCSSEEIKNVIRDMVIKPAKGGISATDAEITAFGMVCLETQLNPMLKEIYAYVNPKTKVLEPMASFYGYVKSAKRQADFGGAIILEGEETQTMFKKESPSWIEVIILNKQEYAEYMATKTEEERRLFIEKMKPLFPKARLGSYFISNSNFWKEQPDVALLYKAWKLSVKLKYGIGIPDEDDRNIIIEAECADVADDSNPLSSCVKVKNQREDIDLSIFDQPEAEKVDSPQPEPEREESVEVPFNQSAGSEEQPVSEPETPPSKPASDKLTARIRSIFYAASNKDQEKAKQMFQECCIELGFTDVNSTKELSEFQAEVLLKHCKSMGYIEKTA